MLSLFLFILLVVLFSTLLLCSYYYLFCSEFEMACIYHMYMYTLAKLSKGKNFDLRTWYKNIFIWLYKNNCLDKIVRSIWKHWRTILYNVVIYWWKHCQCLRKGNCSSINLKSKMKIEFLKSQCLFISAISKKPLLQF